MGSPLGSVASLATGIWLNLQKWALILFYGKDLKSNLATVSYPQIVSVTISPLRISYQ